MVPYLPANARGQSRRVSGVELDHDVIIVALVYLVLSALSSFVMQRPTKMAANPTRVNLEGRRPTALSPLIVYVHRHITPFNKRIIPRNEGVHPNNTYASFLLTNINTPLQN